MKTKTEILRLYRNELKESERITGVKASEEEIKQNKEMAIMSYNEQKEYLESQEQKE